MNKRNLLCCMGFGVASLTFAGSGFAQGLNPPGPPQQQQGFEQTSQVPANYTDQEAEAVEVVKKWIETTNTKDLAAHMALIDDNVVYRGDPVEFLGRSARGYCSNFSFIWNNTWVRLDEMYVVGGPTDTLVVLKRTDNENEPGAGNFAGFHVEVGVFLRVKDGKITEWLDEPVDNMGQLGSSPSNAFAPRFDRNIPAECMQYAATPERTLTPATEARETATPQPAAPPLGANMLSYSTTKLESRFKQGEVDAVRAVRGWFGAWEAGNPKLLASFVDKAAIFRPTPTSDLVNGRDALLRAACATMGGKLDVTDIYVVGAEKVTLVAARWNATDDAGKTTKMATFFRVSNGLITEWMDSAVDGENAVANPNSSACQSIDAALAAFAPLPVPGAAPAPGGAPPGGGPSDAGPPAGGPPA